MVERLGSRGSGFRVLGLEIWGLALRVMAKVEGKRKCKLTQGFGLILF